MTILFILCSLYLPCPESTFTVLERILLAFPGGGPSLLGSVTTCACICTVSFRGLPRTLVAFRSRPPFDY